MKRREEKRREGVEGKAAVWGRYHVLRIIGQIGIRWNQIQITKQNIKRKQDKIKLPV